MRIAIVLGNRLNDDGSLTEIGIDRLLLLETLEKAQPFDKVILSGGIANVAAAKSEAEAMIEYLKSNSSVPVKKCILEEFSRSTWGNARYSVPIALELKADDITIITSQSHLDRRFLCPVTLFKRKFKACPEVKLSFSGSAK